MTVPSKYRNVKTVVDNITFDSKKEAVRYQELKILLMAGIIGNLEMQKPLECLVNGVKVCTYLADFAYIDQAGREVIEDVKGLRTAVYRLKAKLVLACQGIRITEV